MEQPDITDYAAWKAAGYEIVYYGNGSFYGWEWRPIPWYKRMWRKWMGR